MKRNNERKKTQMKGGEKMLKAIIKLSIVAIVSFAFVGSASAGIKNSKHDFSSGGTNTYKGSSTQICIYCHTPHNAVEDVPLWNRTDGSGSYELYTASPTLTSAVVASAIDSTNISWKCLSCHDGTLAPASYAGSGASGAVITGVANLGDDLSNDHPIGFEYDTAAAEDNTGLETMATASGNGAKFYGASADIMECASCHDVHGADGYAKFTRTTMVGSALCLACHIK